MSFTAKTEYGKILVANLRANLVTKEKFIFNNDYQGDASFGQVMIPVVGEDSVSDYSKTNLGSNSVTYNNNAYIPAVLDVDKFINKYFDKYDVHSVSYDMVVSGIEKGAYALAAAEDVDGLATIVKAVQGKARTGSAYASTDPRYQKAGTVIAKTALTGDGSIGGDDIYVDIINLKKAMDKKHVPASGRFLVADAEAQAAILSSDKALKAGQLNDAVVQRGVIAQIAGFDVYPSENMGKGADITVSGTAYYGVVGLLAGHPMFATRVEYLVAEPALYDGNGDSTIVGGSLLKGRMIFTHEVTRPEAFAMLTYPVAKN